MEFMPEDRVHAFVYVTAKAITLILFRLIIAFSKTALEHKTLKGYVLTIHDVWTIVPMY